MLTKLHSTCTLYYNCMYITNFVYNVQCTMYVKYTCTRTLHASYKLYYIKSHITLHMHCMYMYMSIV